MGIKLDILVVMPMLLFLFLSKTHQSRFEAGKLRCHHLESERWAEPNSSLHWRIWWRRSLSRNWTRLCRARLKAAETGEPHCFSRFKRLCDLPKQSVIDQARFAA